MLVATKHQLNIKIPYVMKCYTEPRAFMVSFWTDIRSGMSLDVLGVTSAVYVEKAKLKLQQGMCTKGE